MTDVHRRRRRSKSQSAVTYAVQKMEALLGVKIFEVIGRKG
jgi:DNA-binding transcriptional LysR family regulator